MRTDPTSWTRSLTTAALAAYVPHALVTLYTVALVPCGHCKVTLTQILPVSPGFLASALLIREAGLHGNDPALWIVAGITSAAFIVAVASFGRLGIAWLAGAAAVAFVTGGIGTVITLKMLQA